MKVIHITDTSIFNYDGVATYVSELLNSGQHANDEVLVMTTEPHVNASRKEHSYNGPIKVFPRFHVPGISKINLSSSRGMKTAIKEFNPDVIWIHTIGPLGMKGAEVARGKYQVIYTKHCFDGIMWGSYLGIKPSFYWFFNFFAAIFENKVLRSANFALFHLIDLSKVRNSPFFEKFVPVPPPLSQKFFENRKYQKPKIEGKLRLGFCGRCDPDKGLENTFKGLEIFHEQHPEIKLEFILIGDGPDAQRMKDEYSFVDVTITGYINDVIPYLDTLDAYVLSSKHEMISLSSLEAYARGLPIFSVPIGYLAEKAKDLEGFFIFNNPHELAGLLYDSLIVKEIPSPYFTEKHDSLTISYPALYKQALGRVHAAHV